jgi:hypothetical protein
MTRKGVRTPSLARRLVGRPVVPILVLAGLFEIISGDPLIHALVLFAAGGALVVDERRHGGEKETIPPTPTLSPPPLSPAVAGIAVLYVVVAGSFARYSWPATIAVAVPAALGVLFAWRGFNPSTREPPDPRGTLAWVAVFVGLSLWELATFLQQPSPTKSSFNHPTISALTDPILASHVRRSWFLGLWLVAGTYLLTR